MTRHEEPEAARARCNIELAIDKLGESDRQLARDYLRKGELMGEFIGRASGTLRSIAALVSGSFARPGKWNGRAVAERDRAGGIAFRTLGRNGDVPERAIR